MKMISDKKKFLHFVSIFILVIFPALGFSAKLGINTPEILDSIKTVKANSTSSKWHFKIHPSLGLTLGMTHSESEKSTNLQWLGTLNSNIDFLGEKFDFSSSIFAQYGQSKKSGENAEKIKDAFILSLTPSIPLVKRPEIRLFLETTAETYLGKGSIQNNPSGFCDPLFLYQTLFLGQKHHSYQKEDKLKWDLTYGIGYSFQQTFNNKFQVMNNLTGHRQGFESGFNGILEFNMDYAASKNVDLNIGSKAIALSREGIFNHFDSARKSILLNAGIFYSKIGIEYNFHYVDDSNLSLSPMTDQSLMMTLRF